MHRLNRWSAWSFPVLVVLALTGAGRTLGLGRRWERISVVNRHGILH